MMVMAVSLEHEKREEEMVRTLEVLKASPTS